MRWVVLLVATASAGCQLLFPREEPSEAPTDGAPSDAPPTQRPFGCSPMSMLVDAFLDTGPVNRPWAFQSTNNPASANEGSLKLQVNVVNGTAEVVAEPYLELRESQVSVRAAFLSGGLSQDDRVSLDLASEDGKHRLSYGLVATADGNFNVVADYATFDEAGQFVGTTQIGATSHTGSTAQDFADLVISHTGNVTTFSSGTRLGPVTERFKTDLAPLDWIGYMRPVLFTKSVNANAFEFSRFNGVGATNGMGTPMGEACPATSIDEQFPLSTQWQQRTPNGNCAIATDGSGSLRMTFADNDTIHDCTIHTSTYYNLRESALTLEIEEVVPEAATFMHVDFEIETRSQRAMLSLDIPQNKILALVGDAPAVKIGETSAKPPELPDKRFWRIRGTGDDRLQFEVGDGTTFTPVGATQMNDVGSLEAVRVIIRTIGAGDGGGTVVSFNSITSQ